MPNCSNRVFIMAARRNGLPVNTSDSPEIVSSTIFSIAWSNGGTIRHNRRLGFPRKRSSIVLRGRLPRQTEASDRIAVFPPRMERRIFLSHIKGRDQIISVRLHFATHNVQVSKLLTIAEDETFYRASYRLSLLKVHDAGKRKSACGTFLRTLTAKRQPVYTSSIGTRYQVHRYFRIADSFLPSLKRWSSSRRISLAERNSPKPAISRFACVSPVVDSPHTSRGGRGLEGSNMDRISVCSRSSGVGFTRPRAYP